MLLTAEFLVLQLAYIAFTKNIVQTLKFVEINLIIVIVGTVAYQYSIVLYKNTFNFISSKKVTLSFTVCNFSF